MAQQAEMMKIIDSLETPTEFNFAVVEVPDDEPAAKGQDCRPGLELQVGSGQEGHRQDRSEDSQEDDERQLEAREEGQPHDQVVDDQEDQRTEVEVFWNQEVGRDDGQAQSHPRYSCQ